MASRKHSSAGTVIAVVIAVVAGVWILPRLLAALRSRGGTGSTSGAGALPPQLKLPLLKPPQPAKGGGGVQFGGGGAPAARPSGGSLAQALAGWINNVLTYGWRAAAQMPILQDQNYLNGLGVDPSLSIPLEPMSLFDVGQLATDIPGLNGLDYPDVIDPSFSDMQIPYDQTSLFDVGQLTQDIPGYDSNSYDSSGGSGIDPYYGADMLDLYYNDLSSLSIGAGGTGYSDPGSYLVDPTSVGY